MNTHGSRDTIGAILDIHAMVSGLLIEVVEDVPELRMTEQPSTIVNHPAWTLSHLNAYAGVLLSVLDEPSVPPPDGRRRDRAVRVRHHARARPRRICDKVRTR